MPDTDDIELRGLAEALFHKFGYDFRNYSEASWKRRCKLLMQKSGLGSLSLLQHELLHRPNFFAESLRHFMVPTSEMFRDPTFFQTLREQVVPVLKTYPAIKIWHAGCSTGEEVYSLAILLKEEGLYERCVIYATDINPDALRRAAEGIFPIDTVKQATTNYHASGGSSTFSNYYTALYGSARFDQALTANTVFSIHNLVTDGVFSEMHLILCRNVLIYFKRDLQSRVLDLFTRSLIYKGFLGLGNKETVKFMQRGEEYKRLVNGEAIFQHLGAAQEGGA